MSKKKSINFSSIKSSKFFIGAKSFFKKNYKKIVAIVLSIVVLTAIYLLGYSNGQKTINESQGPGTTTSQKKTQPKKSSADKLNEKLERAKKSVANDLKEGEISKSEANKLNLKIDEIYKFLLENLDVDEDGATMQSKFDEWAKWAKDNEVSQKYLIKLY